MVLNSKSVTANDGWWYEHRGQPPISSRAFVERLLRRFLYATAVIAASLFMGMAGYHWLAGFGWVDAFLNASMILGGMGEVGELRTTGAKIFAGLYALFAGMVFLVVAAVTLTPILHRVMHRFHWEADHADHADESSSG